MRSAFPLLEEASASGSFSAFSFAFALALESTLHLPSLETSLKPRVVVLVIDPEGVIVCFEKPFCAILFILDPIALLVVQVALVNNQKGFSATVARGERGEDYRRKSLWCKRSQDKPHEARSCGNLPEHGSDVPSVKSTPVSGPA